MRRERDPTPEEFEKLLAWLDPVREDAGCKFQLLHSRLIKIFSARGCIDADSLADEVMNRIAVRIDSVIQNYNDPLRCCLGFVDKVHLEYLRQERRRENATAPPSPTAPEVLEKEDECLTQCLTHLTSAERDLFERYFSGEKRTRINARKKLASQGALTANALRIRAFKIRKQLHKCLVDCLQN